MHVPVTKNVWYGIIPPVKLRTDTQFAGMPEILGARVVMKNVNSAIQLV